MNDMTQKVHDYCQNLTRGDRRSTYLNLLALAEANEECRALLSRELACRPALRTTFLRCEKEFAAISEGGLSK